MAPVRVLKGPTLGLFTVVTSTQSILILRSVNGSLQHVKKRLLFCYSKSILLKIKHNDILLEERIASGGFNLLRFHEV